jgi:hypothetical protein
MGWPIFTFEEAEGAAMVTFTVRETGMETDYHES